MVEHSNVVKVKGWLYWKLGKISKIRKKGCKEQNVKRKVTYILLVFLVAIIQEDI
jgi:hypothetical protein